MNVFENFIKTVNYWIIELKSVFYLLKVAQLIMQLKPQTTFTIALSNQIFLWKLPFM